MAMATARRHCSPTAALAVLMLVLFPFSLVLILDGQAACQQLKPLRQRISGARFGVHRDELQQGYRTGMLKSRHMLTWHARVCESPARNISSSKARPARPACVV
jgi:hypothetical protein